MDAQQKKKIINWTILIIMLLLIMVAVRWAESKRDTWLEKQDVEKVKP